MYLDIGNDTVICSDDIIGVFDLDNCTVTKKGRELFSVNKNNLISVNEDDLPKSFIICDGKDGGIIYICKYLSSVLSKRTDQKLFGDV